MIVKKMKIFSQRRQGAKINNILNLFLCDFARHILNVVSHNAASGQKTASLIKYKKLMNVESSKGGL